MEPVISKCAICGELFTYIMHNKPRKYCGLECKRTSKRQFAMDHRELLTGKKPKLIPYAGYNGWYVGKPRSGRDDK